MWTSAPTLSAPPVSASRCCSRMAATSPRVGSARRGRAGARRLAGARRGRGRARGGGTGSGTTSGSGTSPPASARRSSPRSGASSAMSTSRSEKTSSPGTALPLPRELGLEAVDDLHRLRVDAAQRGQVDRDEVAEQDEREHALDRGLAARLDAVHAGRARRYQPRAVLDALLDTRVHVAVVEEQRREA